MQGTLGHHLLNLSGNLLLDLSLLLLLNGIVDLLLIQLLLAELLELLALLDLVEEGVGSKSVIINGLLNLLKLLNFT